MEFLASALTTIFFATGLAVGYAGLAIESDLPELIQGPLRVICLLTGGMTSAIAIILPFLPPA